MGRLDPTVESRVFSRWLEKMLGLKLGCSKTCMSIRMVYWVQGCTVLDVGLDI